MIFYTFHRHRICLVDHVDLICSLYSWWEGFGSSSLATLPLGFNCVLYPPLHVDCPLGFAPVRPAVEVVQLLWVSGVLSAPGTQGSWQLGQQEI